MKHLYKNKVGGFKVEAVHIQLPMWEAHEEVIDLLGSGEGVICEGGKIWIAETPERSVDTEQFRLDTPHAMQGKLCVCAKTNDMVVVGSQGVHVMPSDLFYKLYDISLTE